MAFRGNRRIAILICIIILLLLVLIGSFIFKNEVFQHSGDSLKGVLDRLDGRIAGGTWRLYCDSN
jgi:hypothetical protein